MARPRLLDLFCGAGGCSEGYRRAGFDVVGVDIEPQPRYPFEFVQMDAFDALGCLLERGLNAPHGFEGFGYYQLCDFDAIHASPPCQAHSALRHANPRSDYPELIDPIRGLLMEAGLPYVIENVVGAPLRNALLLCGSMFGLGANGRQLRRHRLFESDVFVMRPGCQHNGQAIGVYGTGTSVIGPNSRRGGYQGSAVEKREAMGIDWMTVEELSQAIPPAYTEHIGLYLMAEVQRRQALAA